MDNRPLISLVTGANKGIGREIAAQLAALGHTVVIGARSAERGEKAAAELRAAGADVTSVVLDVTDPASVAAAAVRMATLGPDGPTVTFTDDQGPIAW